MLKLALGYVANLCMFLFDCLSSRQGNQLRTPRRRHTSPITNQITVLCIANDGYDDDILCILSIFAQVTHLSSCTLTLHFMLCVLYSNWLVTESHQTVKWNSLQSVLKVIHYPSDPSCTVMCIMLNSVSEGAWLCAQKHLHVNISSHTQLATYSNILDWICICPWGCLHTLLIFSSLLRALLHSQNLSLPPSLSSSHHSPPPCLNKCFR